MEDHGRLGGGFFCCLLFFCFFVVFLLLFLFVVGWRSGWITVPGTVAAAWSSLVGCTRGEGAGGARLEVSTMCRVGWRW